METKYLRDGPAFTIVLKGSMTFRDFQSSDALIDRLSDAMAGAPPLQSVVFDLAEVDMIDSHWLGLFVRVLRRTEEKGVPVVLRHPQQPVARLLKLVQFERVFHIET